MDSTVGLMSDPEELFLVEAGHLVSNENQTYYEEDCDGSRQFRTATSLENHCGTTDPEELVLVEASRLVSNENQTNYEQDYDGFGQSGTSLENHCRTTDNSQPIFSQRSIDEPRFQFEQADPVVKRIDLQHSEEEMSNLLTEHYPMPPLSWEPSQPTSEHNSECLDKSIQSTMNFSSRELTQTWTFSQRSTPLKSQISQNTEDTKFEISKLTNPVYQEISAIPASIRDLYSSVTEQYSDYCFSYILASQLCQDTVPMNTYKTLKQSLLLSIASINSTTESKPFHVVCLGAETAISHLLMTSIGQLARRFVPGMLDTLTGGRFHENNFVECGATTLARTGVCYIGDWSMQKPNSSARLLREIESGQVIIENHAISYPLECAIWTCWNYTRKSKEDFSSILMFLNAFGIPIVLPEKAPDSLIQFLLEKSLDNEPEDQETLISENDVRIFLNMLYYQKTSISEESEKLLNEYFLIKRLNTPGNSSEHKPLTFNVYLFQQNVSHTHHC
ncbi:uncharacterized protein LOC131425451 [Malaya genurostris]|uniref:uncharacterized protein LOC131425451 n=1 Tax=Malaya genurostris TaxID=325434 RepID=UPI0026F3C8F7|nr:uncharacterized protein LOC131425451 [Malaya genurostris]